MHSKTQLRQTQPRHRNFQATQRQPTEDRRKEKEGTCKSGALEACAAFYGEGSTNGEATTKEPCKQMMKTLIATTRDEDTTKDVAKVSATDCLPLCPFTRFSMIDAQEEACLQDMNLDGAIRIRRRMHSGNDGNNYLIGLIIPIEEDDETAFTARIVDDCYWDEDTQEHKHY